jgi:RsiW-degrading membrane proteinase PrsW (M82 family)
MSGLLILLAAILPAILLWLYIWKKDTQKEPTSWLIKAVLWGIAICIPVALVEGGIETLLFGVGGKPSSLLGTTTLAFVVAALPEEAFKLFALWMVLHKNPHFDEHFDGIVYAVCVGLGFAAFENVLYLFRYDEWVSVAIGRSLLAVPGHYAFAILMGYYYSIYHFVDHSSKVAACVILVPILAHGTYDAIALSDMINQYIEGLSFLVLIYFCVKMHKVAKTKVLTLIEKDNNEFIKQNKS